MSEQYEVEEVLSKERKVEVKTRNDQYRERLRLDGNTVKDVYRVMVVKHQNGTWEVAESEKLKTDFVDYKKTRQGKWRKLDKRRFANAVMNTVDHYKTR